MVNFALTYSIHLRHFETNEEEILLLTLKSGHGVTGFSVGGYKLFSLVHLIHEITSKDCSENKKKIYKCIIYTEDLIFYNL